MNLKQTYKNILADCHRLNQSIDEPPRMTIFRLISLLIFPQVIALSLYRISHYLYCKRLKSLARLTHLTNIIVTGADIHPISEIGPECLLVHTSGTVIFARIGKGSTIFVHSAIIPGKSTENLDEAPQIGQNVKIGAMASVIGAISIADKVYITPYSLVKESVVESGSTVDRVVRPDLINKEKN